MNQQLDGRVVLVTGANGGLGEPFVLQALEQGATKVYAAARSPRDWADPRIQPLALDITDPDSIARAVAEAPDVDLLVNNAAIAPAGDSIMGPTDELRRIFETNFFGTVALANAFSPVLAANGGGTIVNVLSSAALIPVPTGYATSKAALWSATNALRVALGAQGTSVIGVLVGMIDTPMSTRWDVPKVTPASVVEQAYAGVASGALEVLADDDTRGVRAQLGTPAEQFYPAFDEMMAAFTA
jgi:NAD(P)-dependent dehydrogenase (short-subunit alcohol dehydrogenase family)